MAFTNAQILALEEAIASGALTVRYGDRSVTYQSVSEMWELLDKMRRETAGASESGRSTIAGFTSD